MRKTIRLLKSLTTAGMRLIWRLIIFLFQEIMELITSLSWDIKRLIVFLFLYIKRLVGFLWFILPSVILLLLPYLSAVPKLERLSLLTSYLSSEDNKAYFGVALPTISVLTTYLIYIEQNKKESDRREQEEIRRYQEQKNRERELEEENRRRYEEQQKKEEKLAEEKEQRYLEKRENDFALVRPLFLVKHSAKSSYIELFVRDKVPVKNIIVYMRPISQNEFIRIPRGNAYSGNEIIKFNDNLSESIIIECKSYVDEEIYFQYFAGENTLHYRLGSDKDIAFTQITYNRQCNEILDGKFEIYDIQLNNSHYRNIIESVFVEFLEDIKPYWKFYDETVIFRLSKIVWKESLEDILSSSIEIMRENYKNNYKVFIELLIVVKKYLEDSWYITCEVISPNSDKVHYFRKNLVEGLEKYNGIFETEGISGEIITTYIEDLINLMEEYKCSYEFLTRNIEVYLRDHVRIAVDRIGYDNEISHIFNQLRGDVRKVFNDLLDNSEKQD